MTITDRKYELKTIKSNNTKSGYTNTKIKYYKYKCGWDCSDVYDKDGNYFDEYWVNEYSLYNGNHGCALCDGTSLTSPKINSICSYPKYMWMIDYFQGDTYEEKFKEA